MQAKKTKVVIIGAGPSGLLLGQLLSKYGIDHIILERRSAEYVLGRIRAGVLEQPSISALKEAGVGERAEQLGIKMDAVDLRWDDQGIRILFELAGKHAVIYGQTKITNDLMKAREADGGITLYEVDNVQPHDFGTGKPWVTYEKDGERHRIDCEFIAGCDGFHGVSRQSLPAEALQEFDTSFPFGWLGILADVPPVSEEAVWINHPEGFLMCSLRSKTRSRYYIQVPKKENLKDWDADRFWEVFHSRLPADLANKLVTGPALEMSIAPLHSYVCNTMRYGNMFLVGDSVHVVPPTGAKGLNMAIADAQALAHGLRDYYHKQDQNGLNSYSDQCLSRVWKAVRFSWWMTNLMHKISGTPFERQIQIAELEYTRNSIAAQTAIAENFCGLG